MASEPWATTGLEVLRKTDFPNNRLSRTGTYVVCFGAEWCPVTRRFIPRFIALGGTLPATLAIADITDLNDPLWDDFQIRITPSIIVFREGNILERIDGRRFLGITSKGLARLGQILPVQ
jgi:hypothetical protein